MKKMKSESEECALKPFDIFTFQLGRATAIRRVATCRWALLVGVFLVWTAGIARHYDFRQLHIEHQWIWAPFLVVLFSSILIFTIFWLVALLKGGGMFHSQYLSFLALFLFTAPSAWLYAIPVEHLFPGDSLICAKINIALLGIVSLWRVLLMVRALIVLSGVGWPGAFGAVLLGASVEAFFGAFFKQLDVVGLMGGFELSPTQEFMSSAYGFISTGAFISGIVSIFFLIAHGMLRKGGLCFPEWKKAAAPKPAIMAAVVVLAIWAGMAIPFQINESLREPRVTFEEKARELKRPGARETP